MYAYEAGQRHFGENYVSLYFFVISFFVYTFFEGTRISRQKSKGLFIIINYKYIYAYIIIVASRYSMAFYWTSSKQQMQDGRR